MQIYDLTVPITVGMPVWPGDPPVEIERLADVAEGAPSTVSRLHIGTHIGTHVDAPRHFIETGGTVDRLPLELLVGPAWILDLSGLEGKTIQVSDLLGFDLPGELERLLLKTANSSLWANPRHTFEQDYVHLGAEAAGWLVERGVRLLGIDYLSVEAFDSERHQVHHTLLGAAVVVVEGLDLGHVPAGPCELMCLPLKVKGADGAPARVLVTRD
ncbi:MAG TPA: cyclase family protein [Anaerolineae bacterium]|nr:cyclase family protein [Anaerolineae bacterium]